MNNSYHGSKLIFNGQRAIDDTEPDDVIKSVWVSTALALILSLPSLAVFLTLIAFDKQRISWRCNGIYDSFYLACSIAKDV